MQIIGDGFRLEMKKPPVMFDIFGE